MIVYSKKGRIMAVDNGIHLGSFFKESNSLCKEYMFWPTVQKPNWTAAQLRETADHLDRLNRGEMPDELKDN